VLDLRSFSEPVGFAEAVMPRAATMVIGEMRMVCCKKCVEGRLNDRRSEGLFCHFGHVEPYKYFDGNGN
jgi:hypothetical protein